MIYSSACRTLNSKATSTIVANNPRFILNVKFHVIVRFLAFSCQFYSTGKPPRRVWIIHPRSHGGFRLAMLGTRSSSHMRVACQANKVRLWRARGVTERACMRQKGRVSSRRGSTRAASVQIVGLDGDQNSPFLVATAIKSLAFKDTHRCLKVATTSAIPLNACLSSMRLQLCLPFEMARYGFCPGDSWLPGFLKNWWTIFLTVESDFILPYSKR